jgi:type I restriction enzyme R subunit
VYHQFHAVRVAVQETLRATERAGLPDRVREELGRYGAGPGPGGSKGDRRVGVVWHTQGSGKGPTMAFYAGRIICEPAMQNPTIAVLTDSPPVASSSPPSTSSSRKRRVNT